MKKYKEITNLVANTDDYEVLLAMKKLGEEIKSHKGSQGFIAPQVGFDLFLCAVVVAGKVRYFCDFNVAASGKDVVASEGSYDCMGRYKVRRKSTAKMTGTELTDDNGILKKTPIVKQCTSNEARVVQRMYSDLQGHPIWEIGKRHMLFDWAKIGFYKKG